MRELMNKKQALELVKKKASRKKKLKLAKIEMNKRQDMSNKVSAALLLTKKKNNSKNPILVSNNSRENRIIQWRQKQQSKLKSNMKRKPKSTRSNKQLMNKLRYLENRSREERLEEEKRVEEERLKELEKSKQKSLLSKFTSWAYSNTKLEATKKKLEKEGLETFTANQLGNLRELAKEGKTKSNESLRVRNRTRNTIPKAEKAENLKKRKTKIKASTQQNKARRGIWQETLNVGLKAKTGTFREELNRGNKIKCSGVWPGGSQPGVLEKAAESPKGKIHTEYSDYGPKDACSKLKKNAIFVAQGRDGKGLYWKKGTKKNKRTQKVECKYVKIKKCI